MLKVAATCSLLVFSTSMAGDFPLDCVYVANEPKAELDSHLNCAARTKSGLRIATEHLKKMSFVNGLAAVIIDNQWHYVKPNGDSLVVLTYDNGADYFSEGLTRSLVGNRIAYFDRNFHQIIPPTYDWGWPFENGRALVCRGCKKGKRDDMEHIPMIGGKWGYIDKHGREAIPVQFTQSEAMSK